MPGTPGITLNLTQPEEFAAAPFASGVPTVSCADDCAGGLHDACPSGGPWVRFGLVQAS